MMNLSTILFRQNMFIVTFLFTCQFLFSQIAINEFMASNETTISDPEGEFDDWVELALVSNDTVNLFGWFISDRESNLTKHQFTDSLYIYPDSLLLLWADEDEDQGPEHLSFKLSSAGEVIYITTPNYVISDSVTFGQQTPDVSYGRYPNYTGAWGIMSFPTPGETNLPHDSTEYSPDAIVFPESGFYNSPLYVILFSDYEDVDIYYTLDGSIPDSNSFLYTEPVLLSETTVVRLITTRQGYQPSQVQTHNYVLDSDYYLPTMTLTVDPIDFPIGNEEKNVHVTYFDQNGIQRFACDAGIENHGSSSPQNPYQISFKPEYGTTYIDYPIFENRENNIYKRLILRNASNDRFPHIIDENKSHLRDGIVHSIYERIWPNAGFSSFKSIHVYINGIYWGIYNLRERQDRHYINELFGYEDIDLLERAFGYNGNKNAIEGDWLAYNSLEYFVENSDMSLEVNFQHLKDNIYYDEFIDYWILEVFAGNFDWLSNNIKFWRPRSGEDKWRWLLWDVDHGLGLDTWYDGVSWGDPATDHLAWSTGFEGPRVWGGANNRIIRAILRNDKGRINFINRFADLLNTKLSYPAILGVIDSLANILSLDIHYQADRWNGDMADWYNSVDNIRNFVLDRQQHINNHITNKFDLDSIYQVTLDIQPVNSGTIQINSIPISTFPWSGTYFSNVPITISVTPSIGFAMDHWEGTDNTTDTFILDSLEQDTSIIAILMPDAMLAPSINILGVNTEQEYLLVNPQTYEPLELGDCLIMNYPYEYVGPCDSAYFDIVIQNSGTAQLIIDDYHFTDELFPIVDNRWNVVDTLPIIIPPASNDTIQVRFIPWRYANFDYWFGIRENTLVLENNDPDNDSVSVDLSIPVVLNGTGYTLSIYGWTPEWTVNGPNQPIVDFGTVSVDDSLDTTIVLTSYGIDELEVDGVSSADIPFSLVADDGEMNLFESIDIEITFTPEEFGEFADTIYVESNAQMFYPVFTIDTGTIEALSPEPSFIIKGIGWECAIGLWFSGSISDVGMFVYNLMGFTNEGESFDLDYNGTFDIIDLLILSDIVNGDSDYYDCRD